jgi:hypothetical protein
LCGSAQTVEVPENLQPYTSFTLKVNVDGLFPPNNYVFVDVDRDLIIIGHENRGPMGCRRPRPRLK